MKIEPFTLVLDSTQDIAPGVRHFFFRREAADVFRFVAGQFITLQLMRDDKLVRRSYSIASLVGQSDFVEFAASYIKDGFASELLFNLKPGDSLQATGPFGRLILRDEDPKRYIFVATGTGVTPYRAMLPEIEKRCSGSDLQVVLMQGVRRPEDLLYANDFLTFAASHPAFDYQAFYSREMPDEIAAHENSGYVRTGFDKLNVQPGEDVIYLCGNPDMIDECFADLQARGFSSKDIRREKYISSK